MPKLLNVTTPLRAVAVVVPTGVAPELMVAVTTVELSFVTTLLFVSCSDTFGCVAKAVPEAMPEGFRSEIILLGLVVITRALLAPSEPAVPGVANVNVAALPTASAIDPPLADSAVVDL